MVAALSLDLRERVIAAIEAGASCRQAASGSLWARRARSAGTPASGLKVRSPPSRWGDRHSHRVEAHAALILQVLEERPQIYLREVRDTLQEHGAAVSLSGLSRFVRRHGITRKKGRSTRSNRIVWT